MNYLLDTHIFLWMLGDPGRLTLEVAREIQNPERVVFVSAVSAVEIAIKQRLGKLEAPTGLAEEIRERGLQELPLKYLHGEAMETLPMHHGDPFDRMLLCQALSENLTLITHDKKFGLYEGVKLLMT